MTVDIVVLGGGIAGMWILDRLRADGYAAALLTDGEVGEGQTVASQGIIHSGLKYNIPGFEDQALPALQDMPARWRVCFEGAGEPDLSTANRLSDEFYMHVRPALASGLKAGLARRSMRSNTREVAPSDWPDALKPAGGALFAIDEFVVDVPSVLMALLERNREAVRRLPAQAGALSWRDGVLRCGELVLAPKAVVVAAGAGNEVLTGAFGMGGTPVQRRPLRQIMIAGMREAVYAHVIGGGVKPLATVTSHPGIDGGWVWYVGGGIAESGTGLSDQAAVAAGRAEVPKLFPGADFSGARWASLAVDRAEYGGEAGRPGDAVAIADNGVLVVWPTKLALAPRLADMVLERIAAWVEPVGGPLPPAFAGLAGPGVAPSPWEEVTAWS